MPASARGITRRPMQRLDSLLTELEAAVERLGKGAARTAAGGPGADPGTALSARAEALAAEASALCAELSDDARRRVAAAASPEERREAADALSGLRVRALCVSSLAGRLSALAGAAPGAREAGMREARLRDAREQTEARSGADVVSALQRIHTILSEELARSDESLRQLVGSTELLGSVSRTHDSIAGNARAGRRHREELHWINVRDRIYVLGAFLLFCLVALLIVRKRLRRVHLWFLW